MTNQKIYSNHYTQKKIISPSASEWGSTYTNYSSHIYTSIPKIPKTPRVPHRYTHVVFFPNGLLWWLKGSTFSYSYFLRRQDGAWREYTVGSSMAPRSLGLVAPAPEGGCISGRMSCDDLDKLASKDSYCIPIPDELRAESEAALLADEVGNQLRALGPTPFPNFEDLAILVAEASGVVKRRYDI